MTKKKVSALYVPGAKRYLVRYHSTVDIEVMVYADDPQGALRFAESMKMRQVGTLLEPKSLVRLP